MAWVRIDDGAMTHPKVVGLSDKAFRVWVWGLCYAQTHLTDGSIPRAAVPRDYVKATFELVRALLWAAIPNGFAIHDYLDWNDSRALVHRRQEEAKERMALARERRSRNVRANASERTSTEVPLRLGSSLGSLERESEGKPSAAAIEARAGKLREELFPTWYSKHRHGAKLRLIANTLEYQDAITLCQTWDDSRLEKLAQIVLTTDDEWISKTDRGFRIFALKATWADERLAAWEQQHGVKA